MNTPDELQRLLGDLRDAYDAALKGDYPLENLLGFLAWYIEETRAALDGGKLYGYYHNRIDGRIT